MLKFNDCTFVVFVLTLASVNAVLNHRSRRFLIFPPTAPTRVQIISGIGIPVDLELESVTIGYVFKAEFFLPSNASSFDNFFSDPFDLTTQPITGGRRRRAIADSTATEKPNTVDGTRGFDNEQNEKYEKYEVEAEIVANATDAPNETEDMSDEESWFEQEQFDRSKDPLALKHPQNLGTSRWTIYKGMAALAESKGFSGRPCVLRSICESAHTPFDFSNGILGEMMHVVMSPSTTHDEISDHSDYEYYQAEKLGREGAPCEHVFKECHKSILNEFTGVYTPIMDLMNRLMN